MIIRLWGTRGSIPAPLRSEKIEEKIQSALSAAGEAAIDLSNPTAIRAFVSSLPYFTRGTAGGDTTCLELRSAGNVLIFDCGSGMRRLGVELMKEEFGRGQGVAHIFMSHTHWDHMMGFPFFRPGFIKGNKFTIYGVHPDMEERFRIQQTAPSMFPIPLDYLASDIEFVTMEEGATIKIGQTRVRNIRFPHSGDSYGYRVEDKDGVFIYAGDSEYKTLDPSFTQQYVEFFKDADALMFDAMFSWPNAYIFEDWGHSSAVSGADLATRAGVRRLLLFHHEPYATDEQIWSLRDDAEEFLRQHPERPACEVIVAYDGLEVELWRDARLEARTEHLPDGTIVHLSGILIGETAPVALSVVEAAIEHNGRRPVVANLDEVTHLDREGLTALFTARRLARPFALSGLSSELLYTFNKAGALDYFAIFDSPSSALEALKEGLELRPNQLLGGRYRITGERFDRGPLGDLYLATDQVTRRQVAILVICPSLGRLPIDALTRAAKSTAGLRHPLIAEILEANQDDHIRFLAMTHTPGRSLRQLLMSQSGPGADNGGLNGTSTVIPPVQAVHIASQIAEALEYAHRRDTPHGALKPEYVVVLEDQTIRVTNFGVGRLEIDKPLKELPAHMGRLDYSAPEQLQGHGNSPSSDLYALGTMLYEMLTGQPPFTVSDRFDDLISLRLRQPPVPPRRRNPNLSRSLEYLVLRLLKRSPQRRPADASAVRQALTSLAPELHQKPLLGRDIPDQKLRQHLERVAQGQSGMLVVRGQRGIGKSRLGLSLADQWAGNRPLTLLYGELFAYEDARAFKLFVNALRYHLLRLPARQLSQLLNDLGDLARPLTVLMPELQSTLSALARSDIDGKRLEEAISGILRLLADKGPVVLILDGLQWIDAASLRLLKRLAGQRIPHLLIVALYRSEDVDQDHPLKHTLDDMGEWVDEQLHITPLSPIEVHQMAAGLSTQTPPDFGLWLYGETEGNPLHTEQLIQAYLEGPGETRQLRDRSTTMTIDDVILRRLERLPNGALVTLRQAAVLGHHFHFNRLRAVLDQPEQQALAHLDAALQSGLIQGHPAEDSYRFAQPLIREVIYTEMLGGVRKRYHARVARVVEQEGVSGQMDERVDLLAHHLRQAGEQEKALTNLARAIRRSRRLRAYGVALNYVNQALEVIEQLVRTASSDHEREQRQKQRADLLAARAKLEETVAE